MRFIIFFVFYASSVRTETRGTGGYWEQIDTRDIGENSRHLPDRSHLIFFCKSSFYLRNEKGERRMIGSKSWLGVIGRTIGTFESTMRQVKSYRGLLLGADRCWGYGEEKSGMIGYYAETKHLQLKTPFLSQILIKIGLHFRSINSFRLVILCTTVWRCTYITQWLAVMGRYEK